MCGTTAGSEYDDLRDFALTSLEPDELETGDERLAGHMTNLSTYDGEGERDAE